MTIEYTGIGSRRTPPEVLCKMTEIADFLCGLKHMLRSGGAPGADTAFEEGVELIFRKKVFLPWKGFNGNLSTLFNVSEEAYTIAEKYHPTWNTLKPAAKTLMARNAYQVLGKNLDCPSRFIVCWTPGGKMVGGTAQALRMAQDLKIPVFNLFKTKDMEHIEECMKTQQTFAK